MVRTLLKMRERGNYSETYGYAEGLGVKTVGFRSNAPAGPSSINDLLKAMGKACDFDFVSDISSHSFRRGLSTSAARERVDFELIKKQGGWKSDATVWEYVEEGQQLSENVAVVLMEKLRALMKPGP